MQEEIDHLKQLISIYKRRLHIREEQLALAGSTPDPAITIDIERLKKMITELQEQLATLPEIEVIAAKPPEEKAADKTWSRGYRYLKAEYIYTFSPDDIRKQEFQSTVRLQAVRDGVEVIKDRYSWTGSGEQSTPTTRYHRYVVFQPPVDVAGGKYYYTHLGDEMVRDQKKTVSHYIDLFDEKGNFKSFFSRRVVEETLSLTLKVIIPPKYADTLGEIKFQTRDLVEDRTIASKDGEYDKSTGVIMWVEDDPRPGRQYVIEWDWDYQSYIKSNESPAQSWYN